MNIILANPGSINPAKLIRDGLQEKFGKIKVLTSTLYVTHVDKILIRYANSLDVNCKDTIHNSKDFIRLAGNKLKCSKFLVDNDLPTIEFCNGMPEEYPVFIRKTLNGKGGDGIVICEDEEQFRLNEGMKYYWSPYYKFSSEYRVHVLGNEIGRIFKKVLKPELEEDKYPIRNLEKYDFSLRTNHNEFPKVNELIKKMNPVMKKVNGSFYALDIGIFEKEPMIIEINTGPGLSENTAEFYIEYFKKVLE